MGINNKYRHHSKHHSSHHSSHHSRDAENRIDSKQGIPQNNEPVSYDPPLVLAHSTGVANLSGSAPASVGPAQAHNPQESLETRETFQTLETLETFETLEPLETFETMEPLETFETMEPLETLKTFETLPTNLPHTT
jgi:hypothetical protein